MKNFLIIMMFVTFFVTLTWTIYIPEHTKDNIKLYSGDYVSGKQVKNENKTLRRDLQQTINKYLLKLNNNDDGDNDVENNDGQQTLFIRQQAKTNAHRLLPIPRQQKSYDVDDDVAISAKNRTTYVHENLEAQPTGFAKQQQQEQQHRKIHNNDDLLEIVEINESANTLQHSRRRRQLSDILIAPNTRWCGRGNTANGTYNHLGGASMADKCCRTHDHCKLYIPAMSNRFELFNYRPYTLSHCNCDRRFRTCLKMANDEDANTIGKLFFNLVQTQCFALVKEVICQQRANDGTCLKEHIKQKAYLRNNKKY